MNKTVYPMTALVILCLALAGCATPAAPASPAAPTATARVDLPSASSTQDARIDSYKLPQPSMTPDTARCSPIPLAKSLPVLRTGDLGSEISLRDPSNGRPPCGSQASEFKHWKGWVNYAFSEDWKKLAIVTYNHNGADNQEGVLHIVDMATWQAVTTTLQTLSYASPIVFSPSGAQLAIVENNTSTGQSPVYRLSLYDLAVQKIVAQKSLDYAPRILKYSASGTRLGVFGATDNVPFGTKPQAHVQLFDAASLDLVWEPPLPGVLAGMSLPKDLNSDPIFDQWEPGVVFSADGGLLYIVHSEADVLTKVDFEHQTQVSIPFQPRLSWWERFLRLGVEVAHAKGMNGTIKHAQLSPDGARLYVLGTTYQMTQDSSGNFQFNQIPLGLQVIDPASGAELGKLATDAGSFSLSPDGSRIFLYDWQNTPATEIVDATSLNITQRQDRGLVLAPRLLDGQPVYLLQFFSQASLLDPQTLSPISKVWDMQDYTLLSAPLSY